MAAAALIIATISLGWQVTSFLWRRWETRISKLEQRAFDEDLRQSEAEARTRQILNGLVEYLADVRSLNRPPERTGGLRWGYTATRLGRTRDRIVETAISVPPGHPSKKYLHELMSAFHVWFNTWDEYGDHADTDTGEGTLTAALDALQKARWSAEDGLRRDFDLGAPR